VCETSGFAENFDAVTGTGLRDRANSTLAAAGLTNTRPYQINEYATLSMQSPGGGAWFIGRLERAGADGHARQPGLRHEPA
jgi:hypothetical protein